MTNSVSHTVRGKNLYSRYLHPPLLYFLTHLNQDTPQTNPFVKKKKKKVNKRVGKNLKYLKSKEHTNIFCNITKMYLFTDFKARMCSLFQYHHCSSVNVKEQLKTYELNNFQTFIFAQDGNFSNE